MFAGQALPLFSIARKSCPGDLRNEVLLTKPKAYTTDDFDSKKGHIRQLVQPTRAELRPLGELLLPQVAMNAAQQPLAVNVGTILAHALEKCMCERTAGLAVNPGIGRRP